MLWVGLTGGIGTGKSTVTRILRQRGIPVIDADELAREVVKAGTRGHNEVVAAFGPAAVGDDGELNRKEIGAQVFADKTKLSLLESIIHPKVRALSNERKAELVAQGAQLAFYDVPLLFEKKMEDLFDQIVVISCDAELQKQRLISRNGLSSEEADRRIGLQHSLENKVKAADFTIHNNGSLEELEHRVIDLLRKLQQN